MYYTELVIVKTFSYNFKIFLKKYEILIVFILENSRKKKKMLLDENKNRFVLHPIRYLDIWEFYKNACASIWFTEEIDISKDKDDFKSLHVNEQNFIKMVLAFFAASDGIVNENLAERFMREVQIPEARCFYGFQIAIENIHSETYAILLENCVDDKSEQQKLFNSINEIESIKRKADWCMRYIKSEENFTRRLVAFACVEGIFFSSSFAAIFWLRKKGLMPGLTFSNELISRDEGLHRDFACLLYRNYVQDKDNLGAIKIVKECVEIEKEFAKESLPENLLGMNCDLMSTYIEFVADHLLCNLGIESIYGVQNPFEFMDLISLQGKTNFFEKRVGEYQKAGVKLNDSADHSSRFKFELNEDF